MFLIILIAFFSLIGLVVLHEFGHFILAKKFGVRVEEFGIGYPPRLIGKKIGETMYSLNLLPFGAFVKLPGETGEAGDERSFSSQSVGKRALIAFGGVASFWLVSIILLTAVMILGTPTAVTDEENGGLINPKVQIVMISPGSPAEKAGLRVGDTVKQLTIGSQKLEVNKVKEIQEFTGNHRGEEVVATIERGKAVFNTSLVPRLSPPEGEGAMGVALLRTAIKNYPWWEAPWQAISATGKLTLTIMLGWAQALKNVFGGLPSGAQVMGPVGIFSLFTQVSQLGVVYFLQFIAIISVNLALFNLVPIPAVDGGKLLFLGIEAVRRKPVPQRVEQNLTTFFFSLLIALMVWVTIKDIVRLF